MYKTKLDPVEEWIANTLLGDFYKVLSPLETKIEIKKTITKHINKLLQQKNQNGPYIDLEAILPRRKILEVSKTPLDKGTKAILCPTKGGFKIQINQNLNFIDRRIALSHEIGHTFLYDIEAEIPTMPYQKSMSNYWIREGYAREIARAILVPEESIKSIIRERRISPSIDSLNDLIDLYKVSYDLLCRRLINDLKLWDCLVFSPEINADGKDITIDSRHTSKGKTYEKLNLPKVLSYNSPKTHYKSLYLFLVLAFKLKYKEGEVYLNNTMHYIEAKLKYPRSKKLLSIISRYNLQKNKENTLF